MLYRQHYTSVVSVITANLLSVKVDGTTLFSFTRAFAFMRAVPVHGVAWLLVFDWPTCAQRRGLLADVFTHITITLTATASVNYYCCLH